MYKEVKRTLAANQAAKLGLGACDITQMTSTVAGLKSCSLAAIPQYEHVTWDIAGVLTDKEISTTFTNEVNILNGATQAPPGVDAVSTTFVANSQLQANILLAGFGIHVFTNPECFTLIGNAVPASTLTSATVMPASPDTFDNIDQTGGGSSVSIPVTTTPAVLSYGWPMQLAAFYFTQAMTASMVVKQRYSVFETQLRYLCYFPSFADDAGTGQFVTDAMPYMQEVNARYLAKGAGFQFLPVNAKRIGSDALAGAAGASVFRPTRDYDLNQTALSGLNLQSHYSNQQFHKMACPMLIKAGVPISIQMLVSDAVAYTKFKNQLSVTDGFGGVVIPPIETPTSTPGGAAASLSAGLGTALPELGLDAVPAVTNVSSLTGRQRFKGGNISMSILLKGLELSDNELDNFQGSAAQATLSSQYGVQYTNGS